jgi:hypothetical protein
MCSVFAILDDAYDGTQVSAQALLGVTGNPTLLCILGSRMFFNLKEAGEAGLNEGTNVGSHRSASSSIHFDGIDNPGYR